MDAPAKGSYTREEKERMRLLLWTVVIAGSLVVLVGAALVAFRRRFKARTVELWLRADAKAATERRTFRAQMVERVPEPARRYLLHAIAEDGCLASRVELLAEGELRLKGELKPFVSRELLVARRGFVWKADLVAPVSAVDHYLDDQGEVRVLALGCLPLVRASGPDVTRSSRHRFAIEHIWLPTALLPAAGVRWERVDERRAKAKLLIDAESVDLTLTIAESGRLERIQMQRWSDQPSPGQGPGRLPFRFLPYAARVEAEGTFGGLTIPTGLSVGFVPETDAEGLEVGFRMTITDAEYR